MQSLPRHNWLGFLVFAACLCFAPAAARGKSPIAEPTARQAPQCDPANHSPYRDCFVGDLFLTGTSFDIAVDVCTMNHHVHGDPAHKETCLPDLLKKLGTMPASDRCGAKKIDELLLRQKITEMILTASLEVEGFLGQIDNESNHLREVKDRLTNEQTRALSRSSLGSNIGTGGGAVGSALGIAAKTATAGSWVGAVFGGFGSVFGFINYFQTSKSWKGCFPSNGDKACKQFECPENGGASLGCSPAMLYHLLHPPGQQAGPAPDLFHSGYDPVILKYLNDPMDKRAQELIAAWNLDSSKDEERAKLTAYHRSPLKLSIDDLSDRQTKLADLRALAARINRDLSRLSNDVTMGLAECPAGDGN
jgi:hypothetical protein